MSMTFPNGSFPPLPPARGPLHRGQEGLWFFQADMHWAWKYFLQVEQSYRGSVFLSISPKHMTQSVSSLRSISFASFEGFSNLLFKRLVSC